MRPLRKSLVLLALASSLAAALAVSAAPAQGGLISGLTGILVPSCSSTSQVFAPFGDNGWYYPVPNQGLESGSTGWTLGGPASVVLGNEPWKVSGNGSHALSIGSGGTATSAATCISLLSPHVRLFADGTNATGALQVQVLFRGLTGNLLGVLNYGTFRPGDYPGWRPSANIDSLLGLPLLTNAVQVKFTSLGGTWRIDDLYVDPLRMG
jgi:hypothetical protein